MKVGYFAGTEDPVVIRMTVEEYAGLYSECWMIQRTTLPFVTAIFRTFESIKRLVPTTKT